MKSCYSNREAIGFFKTKTLGVICKCTGEKALFDIFSSGNYSVANAECSFAV